MKLQPRITDDDIEAYLSERLPEARRRIVEKYLQANPSKKAEVERFRSDQEVLRVLGQEILNEPLPKRFHVLLLDGDEETERADAAPPVARQRHRA